MSVFSHLISTLSWHCATKRTRLTYGWRLGRLEKGAIVERGAELRSHRNIRLGRNVRICHDATLLSWGKEGEQLDVGENTFVASRAILDSAGGALEIGENVYIGPETHIAAQGGCRIGKDTQIAAFCYIIAANHNFEDRSVPIRLQGYTCKGIEIGEDCWLGAGVKVLDGVKVGRGCVVAAGAIVTKDLPDYAVAAGVPAKVLRFRGECTESKKEPDECPGSA